MSVRVRVVGLQAAVALLAAALLAVSWGVDEAISALLGGVVACVPNAWFAWRSSRPVDAGKHEAEAARMFGWWAAKVALTVALIVIALALADVGGLGFFVGLGAALLAPLAAPLVVPGKRREARRVVAGTEEHARDGQRQ